MGMDFTKEEVLHAVAGAVEPFSAYIGDELDKLQAVRVRAGEKGHPPTRALILRRLRTLERDGFLVCSRHAKGVYGYEWTITPAGRAALAAAN